MKHYRTPIAAALCTLALAAAPSVYAAGDTYGGSTGSSTHRGNYGASVHGSSSMSTETVRQVQQALSDKGYDVGPIDGMMGPRTSAALRSYQQKTNLTGARGMDSQTLESLGVQASAGLGASGTTASSAGNREVPTASGSNASSGKASDGAVQSRDFKNPAKSSTPGSTAGATASGSNASDGTASDGGPASKNPSNRPLTSSREADRALNPSAPGSNASDGTASDGGVASKNPSGTTPGNMRDSGSSAGGSGAATGGTGGR
jgi:peptidoglycan hydrolase-like protein with peptidoglycan-binding domain